MAASVGDVHHNSAPRETSDVAEVNGNSTPRQEPRQADVMVSEADSDNDGKLSLADFKKAVLAARIRKEGPQSVRLDTECQCLVANSFDLIDRNEDEHVDADELAAFFDHMDVIANARHDTLRAGNDSVGAGEGSDEKRRQLHASHDGIPPLQGAWQISDRTARLEPTHTVMARGGVTHEPGAPRHCALSHALSQELHHSCACRRAAPLRRKGG